MKTKHSRVWASLFQCYSKPTWNTVEGGIQRKPAWNWWYTAWMNFTLRTSLSVTGSRGFLVSKWRFWCLCGLQNPQMRVSECHPTHCFSFRLNRHLFMSCQDCTSYRECIKWKKYSILSSSHLCPQWGCLTSTVRRKKSFCPSEVTFSNPARIAKHFTFSVSILSLLTDSVCHS